MSDDGTETDFLEILTKHEVYNVCYCRGFSCDPGKFIQFEWYVWQQFSVFRRYLASSCTELFVYVWMIISYKTSNAKYFWISKCDDTGWDRQGRNNQNDQLWCNYEWGYANSDWWQGKSLKTSNGTGRCHMGTHGDS